MTANPTRARSRRRIARLLAGPLIALFTIILMLGLGEAYFRFFVVRSDAYDFTLMAKHWKDVCWQPIYKLHSDQIPVNGGYVEYRDRTWTDAAVQGKKKIMDRLNWVEARTFRWNS